MNPDTKQEKEREPDFEEYDSDEIEFISCDGCDGHPACEDFGCAIAAGLGRLVKKEYPWEWG